MDADDTVKIETIDLSRDQGNPNLYRALTYVIAATSIFVFMCVVYFSRLLRPAVDDYCFAIDSNLGFIGGVSYWWENLNGYAFFIAGSIATVGLPLLHLPWSFASALPFILAAVCISLVVLQIFWAMPDQTKGSQRRFILLVSIPLFAITWWTYLWLPIAWGETGINKSIALGLTHFQSLNGSYVISTCVVTGLVILTWNLTNRKSSRYSYLALIPGLIGGFSGIMMTLTIVVSCFLALAYALTTKTLKEKGQRSYLVMLSISSLAAGAIANLAPGSLSRAEGLSSSAGLSPFSVAQSLSRTFPDSLRDAVDAFTNPGSLGVLLIISTITWFLLQSGITFQSQSALRYAAFFFGVALVASVVTRFSQNFAYYAYWHFTDVRIYAFLALSSFGVFLGVQLNRLDFRAMRVVESGLLIISLALVGGSLLKMGASIIERHARWEIGPAPISDIVVDIEDSTGFPNQCWEKLKELRDHPSRSGDFSMPNVS